MNTFAKRYSEDEAFREVANLIYGDGVEIRKMDEKDRKKRQLTAGLSAVGAGAGALGLAAAGNEIRGRAKHLRQSYPTTFAGRAGKLASLKAGYRATPRLTRALIPAEVAGLGGELMATKILHNDTKKKPIKKSGPDQSELHIPSAGKLKLKAAQKGYTKAKPHIRKLSSEAEEKLKNKIAKGDELDVRWEGEFSKVNSDKQQVFGWASIVEMNGEPVVDLQGDYIAIDEVEKSAYEYVHKSRKGGDMHLRDGDQPIHKSDMIESFVVTPEKKKALGLPDETPVGWWVGYQINDPELWQKVKSGERTGFSIHGRGIRSPA